jgi:hypothetical protein
MIVMRSKRLIGEGGRVRSDVVGFSFDKRFEYGQMKRLWRCLRFHSGRVQVVCVYGVAYWKNHGILQSFWNYTTQHTED